MRVEFKKLPDDFRGKCCLKVKKNQQQSLLKYALQILS